MTAKQLAEAGDRQLSVLIASEGREGAVELQQQAAQKLGKSVSLNWI